MKKKAYTLVHLQGKGLLRRVLFGVVMLLLCLTISICESKAQVAIDFTGKADTDVFDNSGGFIITYGMLKKRFNEVTLPGTHNAYSTGSQDTNEEGYINEYPFYNCTEQNQSLKMKDQAAAGIRYFDLDFSHWYGDWVARHGMSTGYLWMDHVVKVMKDIVTANPRTVWVIEVADIRVSGLSSDLETFWCFNCNELQQKQAVLQALLNQFKSQGLSNKIYNWDMFSTDGLVFPASSWLYYAPQGGQWPTLEKMISSGKNLMIIGAEDHFYDTRKSILHTYSNGSSQTYGGLYPNEVQQAAIGVDPLDFIKESTYGVATGALTQLEWGPGSCFAGDEDRSRQNNGGERLYQLARRVENKLNSINVPALFTINIDYHRKHTEMEYNIVDACNRLNYERFGYNYKSVSGYMPIFPAYKKYKPVAVTGNNINTTTAGQNGIQVTFTASSAADDDLFSPANAANNATITYDFGTGTGRSINMVAVAWEAYSRSLSVDVSNDNVNWTSVSYTSAPGVTIRTWWKYALGRAVTERYIRFSVGSGNVYEIACFDTSVQGQLYCTAPGNLNVTNRGAYTATLNWTGSGSNPVSYQVEYKIKSGVTQWNVAATNVTGTSFNLNNLISNTAYQWRVRTNCDQSISSDPVSLYAESSFTTTGPCGNPDNLVTSSIATNQAVVSWSPVPDAQTYYVFYRRKGVLGESFTLIQPVTGTSYTLTNLAYATQYEWTAGAVCTGNNQGPGSSLVTFTTSTPPVLCPALSAPLLTDFITGSKSLVMGWQPVIGANSYTVEYRQRYTATWLSAGNAIPVPSVTITGLFSGNSYEVRVRANCSASNQSFSDWNTAFFVTSFCEEPSALGSSNITPNSATVSWGTTSGATGGYQVQYRETASNTWTTVTTSQSAANSANITGLRPSTNYVWRVRSTCLGSSSIYVEASFTTSPPPCVSAYEPNDYIAQAAAIDPVTTLSASIDRAQDFDFYSITLANAGSIDIRLTNVPANKNYDLELYKPTSDIFNPTLVASSRNTGLGADEAISLLNQQPGTYYVRVFGADVFNDFSASQCYVLNVTATGGGCTVPTGLTSFSVTSSGATVSWTAVSGALDYTVEYKTSAVSTWTTATANSTATSLNLTGLTTSTSYDWRVRANCASGSSGYTQAQFTTLWTATSCNAPTGLSSSGITSSGATVSWAPVVGGTLYEVHYRQVGAINWLLAGTGITGTSFSITGLNASTLYEWRVITLCGPFRVLSDFNSIGQFTTSGAVGTPTRMAQTAGEALGDKEQPESGQRVMLYPNPVDDQLTIISTEAIRTVKLVSVSGQTIAVHSGMNKQMLQLPMGRLVQGVYIVQVITRDGKTSMHKVMKK